MFTTLMQKFFGSSDDRYVRNLSPIVVSINQLEENLQKLSDAELQARTLWFKNRIEKGEKLDDLLIEAFATVREASKRVLNMRHFDVQLMGGIVLHRGIVIEMATGEGKTLISTLPIYLNALLGKGVHLVTVNDYLALRDSQEMGKIYTFLGLSVGCILHELDDHERQAAYNADVTYATNNELGFDYLRDNMKFRIDQMVQRPFQYALIDEVDSILIDEARTPLIISGPAEDSSDLYLKADRLMVYISPKDYEKDEKSRSITLTEHGSQKIEELLEQQGLMQGGSLYDIHNMSLLHHVNQALKAHQLFNRDVDYMVQDDKVIIIDEFSGRMMEGRRYSDGLHQALEAKEHVTVQMENQTLASITFQNLFRLYPKLSGMTGTAKTEAAELNDIYKLEVIKIPTNLPMMRQDLDDEVYRTANEKNEAIISLIKLCHSKEQPVLVGTSSIEKSEHLSKLLQHNQIPHQVLNARYHEQEAKIVAQAGRPGAVTIATNMAGRGTDIKLGGNPEIILKEVLEQISNNAPTEIDLSNIEQQTLAETVYSEVKTLEAKVKNLGGLFVIGTERNESQRIDNQLRGRSGRQGDPGHSKFFLSLEDDLMRIFGADRLDNMLQKLGLQPGEAITHPWINKALKRAQQKVEARNYDIRKHLLQYDNVMNDQRKVIYDQRRELMIIEDATPLLYDMQDQILELMIERFIPSQTYPDQWDYKGLYEECLRIFDLNLPLNQWFKENHITEAEIKERLQAAILEKKSEKERKYSSHLLRVAEKSVLLRILDQAWKDHLHGLDYIRQGINLRAYAQRDPLNEYKQEAFSLFQDMMIKVKEQVTAALSHIELHQESEKDVVNAAFEDLEIAQKHMTLSHPDFYITEESASHKKPRETKKNLSNIIPKKRSKSSPKTKNPIETMTIETKILPQEPLRNSICWCGSGKRYKHCHGK